MTPEHQIGQELLPEVFNPRELISLTREVIYDPFHRLISSGNSDGLEITRITINDSKILDLLLINNNRRVLTKTICGVLYPSDNPSCVISRSQDVWASMSRFKARLSQVFPWVNEIFDDSQNKNGYVWNDPFGKRDIPYPKPVRVTEKWTYDYLLRALKNDAGRVAQISPTGGRDIQLFEILTSCPDAIFDYKSLVKIGAGINLKNVWEIKNRLTAELERVERGLGKQHIINEKAKGYRWVV